MSHVVALAAFPPDLSSRLVGMRPGTEINLETVKDTQCFPRLQGVNPHTLLLRSVSSALLLMLGGTPQSVGTTAFDYKPQGKG